MKLRESKHGLWGKMPKDFNYDDVSEIVKEEEEGRMVNESEMNHGCTFLLEDNKLRINRFKKNEVHGRSGKIKADGKKKFIFCKDGSEKSSDSSD